MQTDNGKVATQIDAADIDAGFVPQPRARISSAELDGEVVLFDEDSGRLHTLDSVASVVWACLEGNQTVAGIAVELAEAFGADPTVVEADVLGLLRELGAQGLLRGVSPEPAVLEDVVSASGDAGDDDLSRGGCE